VLDDLAEVDLGLWEGLLSEELVDRYPKAYKAWTHDPSAVDVPEGERFEAARSRALDQLGRGLLRLAVKSDHPAVGVVVRPLMYGILRGRLLGRETNEIWTLAKDPVGAEWHVIEPSRAEKLLRRAMAGGQAT
jgi:broad specificity phosphatase PhoE